MDGEHEVPAVPVVSHRSLAIALLKASSGYSGAFFWTKPRRDTGFVVHQGTAFLLDAGEGPFLVSAAHVYQQYVDDLASIGEPIVAQFCDAEFDPVASLIAVDDGYDLATFTLSGGQIHQCGKTVLTGCQQSWPPPTPVVPQSVFVTGYPACDSFEIGPDAYNFANYSAILKTDSVGERHIALQIDTSEMEDYAGLGLPPRGYDMGGMSGAPLLALFEHHVLTWHLCGVIYESSRKFDRVYATRADKLHPDGSIG